MSPKRIILEGWHGQLNAGDDAFALVIADRIRMVAPRSRIAIYKDISNHLYKRAGLAVASSPLVTSLGLVRLRWRYLLSRATARVLGGGSVFGPHFSERRTEWWERRGIPSVAIGVSVGPFASERHELGVLRYLEKCDFVSFRDRESAAWASRHRLDCEWVESFDLAVLMGAPSASIHSERHGRLLGVALAGFSSVRNNDCRVDAGWFADIARAIVHSARRKGARIRCFNFCASPEYSDDTTYDCLLRAGAARSDIEFFQHNGDPERTLKAVGECSHFISSRLHGAIFAYISDVPSIIVSYHRKCRQFAETVGFTPEYFFESEGIRWASFSERLDGLLQLRGGFQAGRRLAEVVPLAERNFQFCADGRVRR